MALPLFYEIANFSGPVDKVTSQPNIWYNDCMR